MNAGFEIGSVVAGKFRMERILAEGGMGLVAAATHLQLDQTVALKFFRGDVVTTNESRLRFLREAKAAAQLKSEHVARVLDVGVTEGGAPYIVMEYLEGQGLERVIASERSLAPSIACEYAIQACEALSEAHARGIIHRDIKPSNLFVAERAGWRSIKVLDFGVSKMSLAQASNITTNLNVVMGTPCYMSPEQIQSAAGVDHRTDIWSLGATLYQMLTGRAPFDPGLPILALAEEIAGKEIPSVSQLCPEVPVALSQVVARCLERDLGRRIASAAALAAALVPFAPARAHLVAERAATLASVLGAGARSLTPIMVVPVPVTTPSSLPEIEAADEMGRAPAAAEVTTPPARPRATASDDVVTPPAQPRPMAAADVVTPPAGESVTATPGRQMAQEIAPEIVDDDARPDDDARARLAARGKGDAGAGEPAGAVDVPGSVDIDVTDTTAIGFFSPTASPRASASPTAPSRAIAIPTTPARAIASPTASPRAIAWSEPEADPPAQSLAGSSSLHPLQATTGLRSGERDAAREQGWQAWVESWLTPRSIAALATGSVLLCVFAFLILPRLVHKPSVAVVRPAQGAEPLAPALTAVEPPARGANALVVYVSPQSAQIVVDGVLVRGNPYRAQFPRGGIHLVKAFAAGYEPRVEQAHMNGDVVINLSLERSERSAARQTFGRPARPRPSAQAPARPIASAAPGAVPAPASTVDPHGGRAPLHPIVTTSPYDLQ